MFVKIMRHYSVLLANQPAVLLSHTESAPATSQSAVLFSHNKSAPATRHNQPNRVEGSKKRNMQRETGAEKRCEK